MTGKKKLNVILLVYSVIFLTVFLTSCDMTIRSTINTKEISENSKPIELTVSAAASLKDVMEEIKAAYEKENSSITLTFNFGSSSSLQKQIEQGAAVDVFVSAATKNMDLLAEKGLISEGTRKDFLGNKIVLVVPSGTSEISDFKDLLNDNVEKIGIGEPKSVPAGQYSEELLQNLGIVDFLKSKFVYAKDVREVLLWVETGNADAGFVYETDAKASDKVRVVARAPEGMHTPIFYPAAVIKESKNIKEAEEFVKFLYSDKAKTIFEKYGFLFID